MFWKINQGPGFGRRLIMSGKTPLDGRFMGLDVVDLIFDLNLPGFHSFKYGDDFIEFFVRRSRSASRSGDLVRRVG
jgi:hypothetical protein